MLKGSDVVDDADGNAINVNEQQQVTPNQDQSQQPQDQGGGDTSGGFRFHNLPRPHKGRGRKHVNLPVGRHQKWQIKDTRPKNRSY